MMICYLSASAGLLVPTPSTPPRTNGPVMCSAQPNFMDQLSRAYHDTLKGQGDCRGSIVVTLVAPCRSRLVPWSAAVRFSSPTTSPTPTRRSSRRAPRPRSRVRIAMKQENNARKAALDEVTSAESQQRGTTEALQRARADLAMQSETVAARQRRSGRAEAGQGGGHEGDRRGARARARQPGRRDDAGVARAGEQGHQGCQPDAAGARRRRRRRGGAARTRAQGQEGPRGHDGRPGVVAGVRAGYAAKGADLAKVEAELASARAAADALRQSLSRKSRTPRRRLRPCRPTSSARPLRHRRARARARAQAQARGGRGRGGRVVIVVEANVAPISAPAANEQPWRAAAGRRWRRRPPLRRSTRRSFTRRRGARGSHARPPPSPPPPPPRPLRSRSPADARARDDADGSVARRAPPEEQAKAEWLARQDSPAWGPGYVAPTTATAPTSTVPETQERR